MRWLLPTTWAAWLLDHVPLGPLAPWVFGFVIGRAPRPADVGSAHPEKEA